MSKLIRLLATLLFILAIPFTAIARDLDKSDPVRKELLDAARGDADEHFIVKYLMRHDDMAYLCALKTDKSGMPFGTDDQTDIYNYLFVKSHNKWIVLDTGGGFTNKYQASDCEPPKGEYFDFFPANLDDDALTLWSMWIKHARRFFLANLEDGQTQLDQREVIAGLHENGILKKLPADLPEKDNGDIDIGVPAMEQGCKKNAQCLANMKKTQAKLEDERRAKDVSGLVWDVCTERAIYSVPFEKIEQCVATFSKKRYCRPGMDLFADNVDAKRCVSEIVSSGK